MTTMNISLPDTMKTFVDGQVMGGGYSTSSEYVRDLIRKDQERIAGLQLAALIAEGIESGEPILVDDGYWERKRAALKNRTRTVQ